MFINMFLFFNFIISLIVLLRFSFGCQLGDETCLCRTIASVPQMECLATSDKKNILDVSKS